MSEFGNSAADHVKALCEFKTFDGNASLQNSLELAADNYLQVPQYARKDTLVIFSSLTNCDPGDIFTTISKLKE